MPFYIHFTKGVISKKLFLYAKSFLFWHKCQNSPSKMRLHGKIVPFSAENILGSALKPQLIEKIE